MATAQAKPRKKTKAKPKTETVSVVPYILIPVLIFFAFTYKASIREANALRDYAEQAHAGVIGTYPNIMTANSSDFFVTTQDDGSFYIRIEQDKKEGVSHTLMPVEVNSTLERMNEASILAHQEEQANRGFIEKVLDVWVR